MFDELYAHHTWETVKELIYGCNEQDVQHALSAESLSPEEMAALFSPASDPFLETMAVKSSHITRMRFGNIIQLYAPLYISNECTNSCVYCGFNRNNDIKRMTLTLDQVVDEANLLYERGFRHVLLLTGEHRKAVPVSFLGEIAAHIHRKFASVSIEVYPMETDEYRYMSQRGIDGLTLYQETYNREIYSEVHPAGKKKDFLWRLTGPDRGGMAGFRKIGIAPLLGLADWRVEGYFTALHALYLSKTYWRSHIQISFPRLRKAPGGFHPPVEISDYALTHLICVMRIILPDAGLVLSTREPEYIRDNVMSLGITMMSAGSRTEPGGYTRPGLADNQFSIEDSRSPEEMCRVIRGHGLDPVWKDWDRDFIS